MYGLSCERLDVDKRPLQSSLQVRNVFPTKVLSVNLGTECDCSCRPISTGIRPARNVLSMLPEGFTKRLADLAVQKYQTVSERKERGELQVVQV